jgi:hypothetical protein
MSIAGAAVAFALALAAFGGPKTGDRVAWEGTIVEPPKEWAGPRIGLRTRRVPGRFVFLVGEDLPELRPGEKVRVEGTFYEYSIHMRSVVHVDRVERR